jgi:hypothetical protein
MAKQGHFEQHWSDTKGTPTGGVSYGKGFTISWQNGAIREQGSDPPGEPNGAFVEDVIQAVIGRIEYYQASKYACEENADALAALQLAATRLDDRTKAREARQVEGTHVV